MCAEQTYVYEDVEVKKTGRKAEKPSINPSKPGIVLFEITPVHEYDGLWKKWVMATALFNIVE